MQRGEIYLANFPFGNAPGMKLRSVLLLTSPLGASSDTVHIDTIYDSDGNALEFSETKPCA